MKKIISVFVIFALLSNICVFAADTYPVLESYEKEATILMDLGIISEYDVFDYAPYDYTTNKEILDMINNLVGGTEISDYKEYVRQYVSHSDLSNFQKYATPTISFVTDIVLGVLGYNDLKEIQHFDDALWRMQQAKKIGLYSGIDYSNEKILRRGEAVRVIYNMLSCQVLEIGNIRISEDGYVGSNYVQTEYDALYRYRNIYQIEGVVRATEFTSMYGESTLDNGGILIDDRVYNAVKSFDNYVGIRCDIYISEDTGEVLSVTPSDNLESVEINESDFLKFDLNKKQITYLKNNKQKVLSLDKSVAVIKNGLGLKNYSNSDFDIKFGKISVYDNDNDGKYDLVIIESAEFFVVNNVNQISKTIYNKLTYKTEQRSLVLDDEASDCRIIIYKNGKPANISDIVSDDVLEVYRNTNATKQIIKVVVDGDKISGIVNSVSDDCIEIDGTEYEISNSYNEAQIYRDEYAPVIKPGIKQAFYVNGASQIVAVDKDVYDKFIVGYLYAAAEDGDSVFKEEYKVKIFTHDGKWCIYQLADKVKLNNSPRVKIETVYPTIAAKTGELIQYKFNEDGFIYEIKTATLLDIADSDDFSAVGFDDRYYKAGNVPSFDDTYYIDTAAIIFSVPLDNDEEKIRIMSKGEIPEYTTWSTAIYDINKYNIGKYFVMRTTDAKEKDRLSRGSLLLVQDSCFALNSDGETRQKISGPTTKLTSFELVFSSNVRERKYINGQEVYTTDVSTVEPGDCIRYTTDARGDVDSFEILSRISERTTYFPTTLFSKSAYFKGYVDDVDPSVYGIMLDVNGQLKPVIGGTSTVVYLVEKAHRGCIVRRVTFDDIEPTDYVFIQYKSGYVNTVVIYKD